MKTSGMNLSGLLALCLLAALIPAKQTFATSIFSLNTTGEIMQPVDGRSRGMGGVCLPLFASNVSLVNPGTLGWFTRTSFSATYLPEILKPRDQTGENRATFSLFPHISFVLPLPGRIITGVDLGLVRGYGFSTKADLARPDVGSYIFNIDKYGGAYQFAVGVGRSFHRILSIGAAYERLIGSSREYWSYDYSLEDFSDVKTLLKTRYSGNSYRVGAGLSLKWLNIGLFFNPSRKVTYDNQLYLETGLTYSEASPSLEIGKKNLLYPAEYGLGVALTPDSSLTYGAEVIYSPTSKITVENSGSDLFTDRYRFSLGMEYARPRKLGSSFLSRTAWRAGYYQQTWETLVLGDKVEEKFITLGLGLPLSYIASSLNITLEYGRRSLHNHAYPRESILRFSFSIKGGEKWRRRRKPWDEVDMDW